MQLHVLPQGPSVGNLCQARSLSTRSRFAGGGVAYHKHPAAPVKYHCPTCGVRTHAKGDADYMGGPFVCVFVATLDDASAEELLSGPVRYSDGLYDNRANLPAEIRHL